MWNNSYRTPIECWQKTSDFPKGKKLPTYLDIYIFFLFLICECVCVCFFVWFCLYSLAFTICPRVLSIRIFCFFVFSTCYNWWICFLVWFLSSFFLSLFYYFLMLFIFNNFFILITLLCYFILCYFIFFFLSFFFSPFSSEPCGWQGLGAPAGCQACASEVGEPSSGYWSTRDLPAPRNIKQRKLSQRSPSQR